MAIQPEMNQDDESSCSNLTEYYPHNHHYHQ